VHEYIKLLTRDNTRLTTRIMISRVAVGVDVASATQVAESVERFGNRYLDRVYTRHEQDCCGGSTEVQARGLAARFAAKEAVVKVLRPEGDVPGWTSIEVVRHPAGWCDIELRGTARAMAEAAGITQLAVSLSHEGDSALAVVVGVCTSDGHSGGTS
jgi:holo-[acyl-carrier protein] synthase